MNSKQKAPKDERIVAETNRIYKIGYGIFTIGILLDMLFARGMRESGFRFEWVVFMVAQVVCGVLFVRRGIYTEDAADAETFRWKWHLLLFGGFGGVMGALVAVRNAWLYGFSWVTAVATFVIFALSVMAIAIPMTYLVFQMTKKRRAAQEQSLEDQE